MSVPALATLPRPAASTTAASSATRATVTARPTRTGSTVTPITAGRVSRLPSQRNGGMAPSTATALAPARGPFAAPATGAGGDSVAWAAALALSAAEVMRGQRPIGQLHRWVTGDVYDDLARRANRASAHVARRGRAIQIRRVCRCEVSDLVIEATVILQDVDRSFAVTVRLEWRRDHWLATHLRLLIPQGRIAPDPTSPGLAVPRSPQRVRCV